MTSSSSRNVTASPSISPHAAAVRHPPPARGQTSTTSAATSRNTVHVSLSTYCSSTSSSGSNSTGIAASAAIQARTPNRTSTAYTSTLVASPTRCCTSETNHMLCSSMTGTSSTEYPLC